MAKVGTESTTPTRILGVDPGLASCGVGVIEWQRDAWRRVHSAEVKSTSAMALPARLQRINELVRNTIRDHHPDVMAIESVFYSENVRSLVMMAHGRGVAVLAAAESKLPIYEYSPLEIKQSVVGHGRASKSQVMQMVKVLLSLDAMPESDHQADALACALAHAYRSRLKDMIAAADGGGGSDDKVIDEGVGGAKALLAQVRKRRRR